MVRLFIALDFSEEVRDTLADLCEGVREARWTPREQLHCTLRFIGDVPEPLSHDIAAGLRQITGLPFYINLAGVGHFPPRRTPRILWAGIRPCSDLSRLQKKIESVVRRAGCRPETRSFHPHITLARLRAGAPDHVIARFEARHNLFSLHKVPVTGFSLYASRLLQRGAQHERLHYFDLVQPGPRAAQWESV